MNWWDVVIALGIIAAYVIYRNSGLAISIKDAQGHLKHGALVIDVRSAGEFVARHLPVAVNLPLSEIETNWNRRINDKKNQVLAAALRQSGTRSGGGEEKADRARLPEYLQHGWVCAGGADCEREVRRTARSCQLSALEVKTMSTCYPGCIGSPILERPGKSTNADGLASRHHFIPLRLVVTLLCSPARRRLAHRERLSRAAHRQGLSCICIVCRCSEFQSRHRRSRLARCGNVASALHEATDLSFTSSVNFAAPPCKSRILCCDADDGTAAPLAPCPLRRVSQPLGFEALVA